MSEDTKPEEETADAPADGEWEYPPAPTAYDLVRDNFLMRGARLLCHMLIRLIMRVYHRHRGVGSEHVLDHMPCIIAPNHTSNLDNIAIFAALPLGKVNRICSVAGKKYFFENPFLALVARLTANGIPLDHTGGNRRGLRMCARKLKEGCGIIIFPEGMRTKTGEVGRFKAGAVALCRGLKVPVIPTYLKGTFESMSRFMIFPRARRITVTFAEPVRFWEGELAELDHREAAQYLEDRVRELKAKVDAESSEPPPPAAR
jgi:1-acyl-sn-glycerol-3-phosphate acyltransferase